MQGRSRGLLHVPHSPRRCIVQQGRERLQLLGGRGSLMRQALPCLRALLHMHCSPLAEMVLLACSCLAASYDTETRMVACMSPARLQKLLRLLLVA